MIVFDCEQMREGCPGMTGSEGYRGPYFYLAVDTSPD
jgi:hypothetical protein